MMNHYPAWKYVLIALVLLTGVIYAMPNLYPNDPAVQISSRHGEPVTTTQESQAEALLKAKGLAYKSVELADDKMLVRFNDTETQLMAMDALQIGLGSQYTVAVNLAPSTPAWLRDLDAKPMYLGLDLRGGVHFLMEVDMKAAISKSMSRYESEFRSFLRDKKIRYLGVSAEPEEVLIKFRDVETRNQALDALREEYRNDLQYETSEEGKTPLIRITLSEQAQRDIKDFALKQNITTLRKRVNELGVAEPVIQRQGNERIVVQLPGVQDTARAKDILGATATLEFRLVDEKGDPYAAQASGRIPAQDRLYKERNGNPVLLRRQVMLTGDYITNATSSLDENGRPAVSITLDGKGARLFSKVTAENVKKLMAVVYIETKTVTSMVDGETVRKTEKTEEVINIARIQSQLSKRFQITGLDSSREAHNLALLLRAGALAAPMQIIEERTVGPSLGQENIDQGFKSVFIGFVLVLVFMAVYYRVFGLVANLALAFNLVLIIAALSILQATLTMPGIAGIVLTVGMAVDANVLIYERIREELRNGVSPQTAIYSGYEKAFSTIADANVTTLIAAVVLFAFGTGPIKGFAVTLSLGIISSMFTAIMGTRAVINLFYGGKRRVQKLSIGGGI
jgi:preprotein translocase subunit SecD